MTPARHIFLVAAFLLLAAVLQGRVAHAIEIRAAEPDLVLVVLTCGGTLLGGEAAIILGFWAGLLTAALFPDTIGSYLASRTIAGAFAGWLQGSVIRDSIAVPPLASLATVFVAECTYALMTPTHDLHVWLVVRGGEMLYNALLAVPVYALLRRLHVGRRREDPFAFDI
jgi:rod shape-determining protein MreD